MVGLSPRSGQALVEFSLVAPLFFFLLFFSITAGTYTLERATIVEATTTGARVAAGAAATGRLDQPALREARNATITQLTPGLFRTTILTPAVDGDPCPPMASIAEGTVFVCASQPSADQVTVGVRGHPRTFLPAAVGGFSTPVDTYATIHTVVFRR